MAQNNLILLKCKLCGLPYVLLATIGRKEKKKVTVVLNIYCFILKIIISIEC